MTEAWYMIAFLLLLVSYTLGHYIGFGRGIKYCKVSLREYENDLG